MNCKRDSEYKTLHSNGQLWKHCYYKNGKRDGEYKTLYDNGQLRKHCYYKDGKLDGECKIWYDNGQPWEHCYYINDGLIYEQFQQHKKSLLFIRKKLIERYRIKQIKLIEQYILTDLAKLCVTVI